MNVSRVIVMHGYSATPADHWFEWLAKTLESAGVDAQIPELPDPESPELERWVATAAEAIGTPDEETAVVAHSLGAVTTLHALDRMSERWRLGALIAVAGFTQPLPVLPQLDPFTRTRPDVERTASRTGARTVVVSDADSFVPPSLTLALGAALGAEAITVPGAGHFLAGDGVTALPQVADLLLGR